jgi:hypothetical protein
MITTEIKVNGCLIAHLYIHNEGMSISKCYQEQNCEYADYCTNRLFKYIFHYFVIETNEKITEHIYHCRRDSALSLVHKCIEAIENKKGK